MAIKDYFAVVLLSLISISCAQYTATASPAPQASSASSISDALNAAFAGFGIEPSNLFSFTGGSETNIFSVNLLENLAQYSGMPPHLRIGGNTADQMLYNPDFHSYSIKLEETPTGQGKEPSDKFIFGPSYWKALSRFPKGTPVTFGLNLAYMGSDNLERIVGEARACLDGLSHVRLSSFEIGNEPDLYLKNQFRSGGWDGALYVQDFLYRAAAIYREVLKPAGLPSNFFEPAATASTIGTSFQIKDLADLGILNTVNGSGPFVAGWNQHDYYYFVDISTYQLTLNRLMQLSTTEDQFTHWTGQIKQAAVTNFPYYLREMANAGPIGLEGISDTFGAALWTLNFLCYAASIGVASVQFHMTDNSFASPWQPIEMNGKAAHVRPTYYAFAAIAQIIGSGNGTTQIAAFSSTGIPQDYSGFVRTYATYTNGNLSAVILINSRPANAADTSKSSLTFSLSLPSAKGQTLYISTLKAPGADSQSDTTWNGISYEKKPDGTPTIVDKAIQSVQIDGEGNAQVTVQDSQAIIANIGYLLGSRAVLSKPDSPSSETNVATVTVSTATAAISVTSTTAIILAGSTSGAAPSPSSTASPTKSAASAQSRLKFWRSLHLAFGIVVISLAIAQA